MARWSLHHGDCLEWLRTLPSGSVDSVVTDPPAVSALLGAMCALVVITSAVRR